MKMNDNDDLRPEYSHKELGQGVRGKYLKDAQLGTNLVLLDPDVAAAFPDHKVVNETLRALISIAKKANNSSGSPV